MGAIESKQQSLRRLANRRDLSDNSTELSNKILETLRVIVIRECRSCIEGIEDFSVPIDIIYINMFCWPD